jgi:phosphoserine aminotransferase
VSFSTLPAQVANRVFNFTAGPSALPVSVLEQIRQELLDYHGTGMSVMEMSHRSPEFEEILAKTEQGLRRALAIPEEYAVIFLQGGGSMQFMMAPMNLYLPGKPVDVLHTGLWTAKAIAELKKGTPYRLAASTEPQKFTRVPRAEEIALAPDASYVYMCTNNTIEGTQWNAFPETGDVPLVADMSSDIASRPFDPRKFGMIFAGSQKNLGSAGVTIVIIRRDLAERADKKLPALLQYRTEIEERSLYHTPPMLEIYITGLMLEWIESQGGVSALEKINTEKAKRLYDAIDSSAIYSCPVEEVSRSKMNVVFRIGGANEAIEKEFVGAAAAARIVGVAGHRSVGGIRASLYNAVTLEAVDALVAFMCDFERVRG